MAQEYDNIDRPFGAHLERQSDTLVPSAEESAVSAFGVGQTADNAGSIAPAGGGTSSGSGGGVTEPVVKNESQFSDLWIQNTIKSLNWKPKKQGFYIDGASGYAEFSNIFLSGSITAREGLIGGWTITDTSLYGGTIKTGATVGEGGEGVIMDTDGLRGYSATLGEVFNLQTDGSPPSFSSGVIRNTEFQLETVQALIRTSPNVADGSVLSAGVLINSTGFYGLRANQTIENGSVRIRSQGTFFVGDSSNYIEWDGTYLRMKGSFDVGVGGVINNSVYTVATLPSQPTSVGFNSASANAQI